MNIVNRTREKSRTTIVWETPDAERAWCAKLSELVKVFELLQWQSVAHSLRPACRIEVAPENLAARLTEWRRHNLSIKAWDRVPNSGFTHLSICRNPEVPFRFSYLLARQRDTIADLVQCIRNKDHFRVGELFGYPVCCRHFFEGVWVRGDFDPIWQIAANSQPQRSYRIETKRRVTATGIHRINPLLRYIGIRLIPHLPHSFSCLASDEQSLRWINLGRQLGYAEEIDSIEDLLSDTVCWTAVEGVAKVRTSKLTIDVGTVMIPEKRIVQLFPSPR